MASKINRKSRHWRYVMRSALLSAVVIATILPIVDDYNGFSDLPDRIRGIAMLILLIVDFPSLIAMKFIGGSFWPESLPIFIFPTEPRAIIVVVAIHFPTLLFWSFVGFIISYLKE